MRASRKFVYSAIFGVVLLEVALQLAGLVYVRTTARSGLDDARHRVLCAGDSHTFGLWLAKDDSYPSRLDKLLSAGRPAGEWAVENSGVPGYGSGDVLERIEHATRQRHYEFIVVMAGANDRWKGAERTSSRPWYEHVKTVKLLMLLFRREPPPKLTDVNGVVRPDDVAGRPTEGKADTATVSLIDRSGTPVRFEQRTAGAFESDSELVVKLERNCAEIVRIAQSVKSTLVFLAYPNAENDLGLANRVMADAARKLGVPFVDLTDTMSEAARRYRFEDLFTHDRHPAPLTCELMARTLVNHMVELRVLEGKPVADLWSALPTAPPRESPLEFTGTPSKELFIRVKTNPGRRVHFFLSFTDGDTDVLGHRIPIGRDALFEKTVDPAHPTLTQVVAGADGIANLPLTPILGPDVKPGSTLHAAAAILGIDGAPGLHDITPPKALEFR